MLRFNSWRKTGQGEAAEGAAGDAGADGNGIGEGSVAEEREGETIVPVAVAEVDELVVGPTGGATAGERVGSDAWPHAARAKTISMAKPMIRDVPIFSSAG
jgi:hypothetical protein